MTKKITRYSLVIIFIVGIFLFKTEVSQAANQISKVDFENNLTDSLGYIHAYEYWYNHPSNPDHIVTYVPGHTGLAAWSTHNLDDSGGDLNIAFPSSPFPATDELYIKYWVKFDANYSNCVGNTYYNTKQLWFDGGSLGHTEIAFTSFSDTGVGLVWQGGSGTPIGSDWFGASYTRGDWMKVEIYMKLSSGTSHSNPDGHFVMAINNEIVSDRNNIITGHYNGAGLDRSPALKATCDSADGHGGWAIDDYEVWDGLPPFAFMSSSISTTPPSTICTESWSCTSWSAWSTCTNNSQSQTKTCTDANSCGTTTSKPITTQTQSCTTSQTVSTKLAINDRVKTTTTLNVRATPSITGTLLGSQVLGAFGTIIGGPVSSDGYWWWQVNYDNAPDGWSVEQYLEKYLTTSSATCTESWSCSVWSAWSACNNSSQTQTRACTDVNSCGTTTSKPTTTGSQACTSATVSGSSLLFQENFDDQEVDSRLIVYGPNWSVLSPPDYNLNAVGRNGTGYSFSSGNVNSAHLVWKNNIPSPWPSDEMHVSFWMRYPNFTSTDTFENFKLFYPHWNGVQSYVHYTMMNDGTIYYSAKGNGTMIELSKYIGTPNMTDGKWHHYEFYIKFSTGISKFWYDGTLKLDADYADGVWTPNNVYYVAAPSIDAEETGTFSRQVDDWEVRDGMPSSSAINPTPTPTTCTSFTYSSWNTCQSNNTQTRTVITSSPTGCTGGSPVTTQSCTITPTVSTKLAINDNVKTTTTLNVRATPSITGTLLGSQVLGAFGTIIGGPVSSDGYWWWQVNYDNAPDGWSVEQYLEKYLTTSSATCTESWSCSVWSAWSACNNSSRTQTRACTDVNSCGTTTNKPSVTQTQACTATLVASTKLAINDRAKTTTTLNVRATPSGTYLGTQAVGLLGTIIGGPVSSDGYWWWQVNYDSAPDGWSAENWLEKYTITSPVTCTNFTYSTFGTCQSNGTQSRTIISSTPTGCVGGSPVLTQSCIYTPPVCIEAWTCSSWSAWGVCSNNSQTQTRTCTDANSCGTTATKPITTGTQTCALSGIYQCNDGIDNDSDGKIDYPIDPGCASAEDNDEYDSAWVDTIAPSAPARLQATSISSSQINLTWVSATDDLGVAGYHIYRCAGTSCTPTNSLTTTITNFYSDTALIPNTNYTYSVKAFDMAGNLGAYSNTATVGGGITDTVPPVISSLIPTGILPAGTTSTILSVTTNETAICKYSTVANTAYDSMTGTMTASGDTHSAIISRLSNGNHNYYIKCRDTVGNTNTTDANISFSIATSTTDQTPIVNPVGTKLIDGLTCSQYFNATLSYGMENEQVKKLQEILSLDKKIYPKGINSGYYGNLTIKAVQRYQCKYDVVCSGTEATTGYGVFGPMTRKVFCDVYNQ